MTKARVMKYRLEELHPGMSIRYPWIFDKREKRQMLVQRVIYRRGQGLRLIGTGPDGYSVAHYPHPDDLVEVTGLGPNPPEPVREGGIDFPYAEIMG